MLKSIKKQWFYTWITKKLRKQFYQSKIVFNCKICLKSTLKNERRKKKIWKKKNYQKNWIFDSGTEIQIVSAGILS